jgi:hypothetical protein
MSNPYIDADDLDDIRTAHISGIPLDHIANQIRVPEADLKRLLRLPEAKPAQTDCIDLWSVDRLHAAL